MIASTHIDSTPENSAHKRDSDPLEINHNGGRSVLVIEDDADVASLTQFLVERYANARCDTVQDSYEAIAALCEKPYDYLVVDHRLPGMKGVDFLITLDSYLDRDPTLNQGRFVKKLPVLLMSGSRLNFPRDLVFNHFDVIDVIHKRDLMDKLKDIFAS
jgi:CheY-like chemotaxis protein